MSLRVLPWLRSSLRALGPLGVVALGVLLFCPPFYLSALRPAERELAAQRSAAERARARQPLHPVALEGREEELARFYALFPPAERLTDELQRVYKLAHASGLELMQGEYRVEKRTAGLVFYRVSLPVRGSYAQIRSFVGAVLTDIQIASVDALRFERKKSGDSQLEAQLKLTLHFRPSEDKP